MQRALRIDRGTARTIAGSPGMNAAPPPGGCYGIQVLVAGRHKRWRDQVSGQVRRAGYQATACDSAVDALTVLVLGLPIDVLVADVALHGSLCCARLAAEARALRPGLRIILASEFYTRMSSDAPNLPPGTILIPRDLRDGVVARTVRDALANRPG